MATVELAPEKLGNGFPFPAADYPFKIKDCYKGNPLIKAGHVKVTMTEEQTKEFFRCALDPIYFLENYCRILSLDEGIVPFKLYGFQKDMIKQYTNSRFCLTLTSRQMGKTTVMAGYLIWCALFHKQKSIAVLANKGTQAQEIMDRIRTMFEYLPFFMQAGVLTYNKTQLVFDNGSKIFSAATSNSSIRGRSCNIVYIDEAAHIERDMQFYESTYPVISSGKKTQVIMTTTPKGSRGMFFALWRDAEDGKNSYKPLKVTWERHPDRDRAWADETMKNIGRPRFRQEFDVEFMGSAGTLISSDTLSKMEFYNPINEDDSNAESYRIYENPKPKHRYIAVADPAGGTGNDYSVCTVFDVTTIPYKVVAMYRNNTISPLIFPYTIVDICGHYGDCPVLVETNNDVGGQVSYILYYEIEYENTVLTSNDDRGMGMKAGGMRHTVPGIKTTSKVKNIGCSNLRTLIENNKLIVSDLDIIQELGTFIQKGNSYEADTECHDDTVMTLVLLAWFMKQDFFKDYSENDMQGSLYQAGIESIKHDMLPVGVFSRPEPEVEAGLLLGNGPMKVTTGDMMSMEEWMRS